MDNLLHDIRYSLRTLRRSPGFTAAALAVLALGIGANTAIFSLVNGVLLRPLPYGAPDRLVTVWNTHDEGRFGLSEQERLIYSLESAIFDRLGVYQFGAVNLSGSGAAERLRAAAVDAAVLPLLDAEVELGRGFAPEEDAPGMDGVAVLSHGLWQRRFGGDRDVIGRSIILDGAPVVVIGVLAPEFRLPLDFTGEAAEVYVPLALAATPDPRNLHYLLGVARLAPGLGLARARTDVAARAERAISEIPTLPPSYSVELEPVRETIVGDVRPALLILLGAVGLVLLIACANVANLLLVRAERRRRELAVRTVLGAGRGRLIRGALTESITLALLGGALGLAFAAWATQMVVALGPPGLPRLHEIGIDGRVLGFTVLASVLTGVLFGAVPAFRTSATDLRPALNEGQRGSGGVRLKTRRALIVGEVALAVALATGAGLMVRSFMQLQRQEAGFRPDRVLTARISLPGSEYPNAAEARRFYRDLLARVRELPGVVRAGAVTHLPLRNDPGDWGIFIEGRDRPSRRRGPFADWLVATEGYFRAMGIPLLEGRTFDAGDRADAPGVVVINRRMARDYWPGESAVGKRLKMTTDIDTIWRTVVGVVGDIRHQGLDREPRRQMFLPHSQFPATADFPISDMSLAIRTAGAPLALSDAVRQEAGALDPAVPIAEVREMREWVAASTAVPRLYMWLFAAFAGLSLVLVAVGVYGVMAYLVASRRRELGIRVALGARAGDVIGLVLREGTMLALAGIAIGLAGSLAAGRVMESLLFGVSARDPVTLVAVCATLLLVALAANYLPARRAAAVDPVSSMKSE